MAQFHETMYGKRFFDRQLPALINSFEKVVGALEKQNETKAKRLNMRNCKHFETCSYRAGVGECPIDCVSFKNDLIYCAECKNKGNETECPLLSFVENTEDDDFCSFGKRK